MKDLKLVYGWKTIDFVFPSIYSRQAMVEAGSYVPGNAIILDTDYWQNGKLLFSFQRQFCDF